MGKERSGRANESWSSTRKRSSGRPSSESLEIRRQPRWSEEPLGRKAEGQRAAEEPPADEGRGDLEAQGEKLEGDQDLDLDCMSFQQYEDDGGVWLVACREPDEDVEGAKEESLGEEIGDGMDEGVVFRDDRTGKPLDAGKVRAAREEELRELDRRVWQEADVQECWEKKGRGD